MPLPRLRRPAPAPQDLSALLNAADPRAPRALRHLWLIDFIEWLRRPVVGPAGRATSAARDVPLPVQRLRQALHAIEHSPDDALRVGQLLAAFVDEIDWISLLADHGFSPQPHFVGELFARLRGLWLPVSPDTADLSELFNLLFPDADDATWLLALEADNLDALGRLISRAREAKDAPDGDALVEGLQWREPFFEALLILCAHIRAAGTSQLLRPRFSTESVAHAPFRQLVAAAESLYDALLHPPHGRDEHIAQKAHYLRGLLDACRHAADTVPEHLNEHGVSINIVFQVDQLRERVRRAESLLDCLLSPTPAPDLARLLSELARKQQERRSLRALFSQHYSLLTRKVVERSADTGEHYITRSGPEYRAMLIKALGGGAVLAVTTLVKFVILRASTSPFWLGLGAGLNYALSFVLIYLLGWTVATKQPAMTAPALAAKLGDISKPQGVEAFVDEVTHLIRSQVAGIIGNMCAVAPVAAALSLLLQLILGHPPVREEEARHVVASLTLFGPTLLYAALTGVLLFLSSLIAGWVENWFVLHRLESAIAWSPGIRRRLGAQRALRWSRWWRAHISGLSSNVSLGLLLGLVPAVAGFFALPLEVRHVTLSTGQAAAALATLGDAALHDAGFWWGVAALPLTGLVNVGVSFYLAFRLALRSRGLRVKERAQIYATLARRLLRQPMAFLVPPRPPRHNSGV